MTVQDDDSFEGTAVDPDRSALVHQIDESVEELRAEIVTFLQEIVRIPSVTGSEGEVQAVVAARFRGAGLETDVWEPDPAVLAPYSLHIGGFESLAGRPNVVGRLAGTGGGRSLILNAHIDTVEPGDAIRWTHPPYGAQIENGLLYGRGACDMKAGLVTNLFALLALRAAGHAPCGDVILQSVISEEDGGTGTLAAILRGYRADGAIVTEPTSLAIVPAHGGSLVFRLHVSGRAAHGAVRDEGVSAVEKFSYLHRALLDFEAERNAAIDHPLYAAVRNKVPVSIGVVHAGSWPSTVPEELIAEGRAGLVPGEDLAAFQRTFVAAVDRAAAADAWLSQHPPRVEWFSGQFAPAEIPADSPLVGVMARASHAVTGHPPAVEAVTYGADMRHFLLVGNMPCLMFGAGDVRVAHFADEYVAIHELLTATKALALAVAAWCGVVPRPT